MTKISRVLVIEDAEPKWERIELVLRLHLDAGTEIVRARDQFDGERLVDEGNWDLILLDISLDIRAGNAPSRQGGQDYTGGLKIAGRMYYNRKEAPTIIVTGFDNFPTGRASQGQDVILGLQDVDRQAAKYLGAHLIGTLRYGPPHWESDLIALLEEYKTK